MLQNRPPVVPLLIIIVLLFVDGSLIFACWILATSEIKTRPSQSVSERTLPKLPIPVKELDEVVAGEDALARPVFSSTRRPYEPPVTQPEASSTEERNEEMSPPDHSLAGVFIGAGQPRALLRNSDGKDQWLANEEEIDGWRLIAVTSTQVVLQEGDKRVTLELYPSHASPKQ